MPFYAVAKRRNVGIYQTWEDCEAEVKGFSGARYKKFRSLEEAASFIQTSEAGVEACAVGTVQVRATELKPVIPSTPAAYSNPVLNGVSVNQDGWPAVYCGGTCEYNYNGRNGARAGIGVFWGKLHHLNACERLLGKQTVQRAHITACSKAIETARHNRIYKLEIRTTDSFVINAMTHWIYNWKLNGWKTVQGTDVRNVDDFLRLDCLMKNIDMKWVYVTGDCGSQEAARLAHAEACQFYPTVDWDY